MESLEQDSFDKARFATVLRNLKRDNIPSLASGVRYSGHPSTNIIDIPTTPRPVGCKLLSHITCGSYNAVFTILFADGTLWVLKIPANGHSQCWDAPASEALRSEAFTMRLIRRETTISVPEVFAFDASLENELGCPYILMELIHGKPLQDVWFDQGVSQALREQRRIRSLHGIAEAMTQLNSLAFRQGGSLLFDAEGEVAGIGSSNIVDLETQYANMRSPDYDNKMAFCQTGPFSDAKSYLLSLVDARQGKRDRGTIEQGAYKLLRLFIDWSLMDMSTANEKHSAQEKPFVLAHPDLDSQNILVNDDGSLAGLIDWDWIAAVPRCVGPQSFPKFLTQDYDNSNYAYDIEAGEPKEGYVADSPAELACYRALYAQFMESYVSKEDGASLAKSSRYAAWVRKSRKGAANVTRRSLITNTLHLAAKVPTEMKRVMVHLFDEIEELTASEWQESSSTAYSGEQDNNEESGNKDEDTEASEVEESDVVEAELDIQDVVSDEKLAGSEYLSIDKLMDEIEKLMGMPSAGISNRDTTQDSANLQDAPLIGGGTPEPPFEGQNLNTVNSTKEVRQPRAARVCGWVQRKLRREAKRFHKESEKEIFDASAASTPTSKAARVVKTLCGWTEKRLRRVAYCLHCDNGEQNKITFGSNTEAVRNGGNGVLKALQTKLKHLRQNTRCEGSNNLESCESSDGENMQDRQIKSVVKELTRAEKRSVCGQFTHMIQDQKVDLTVDQQVAVAHWMIQTLQNPDFSDTSLGTTSGHPNGRAERHEGDAYGGDGDSGNKPGCVEGHGIGHGNRADDSDGSEGTEGMAHQDVGESHDESMDQIYIPQPSSPLLSTEGGNLATKMAETDSNEEGPSEVSQATTDPTADDTEQEDTGGFYLLDVCIALANDDLDERRMKRLRDGFFGLLNQTM